MKLLLLSFLISSATFSLSAQSSGPIPDLIERIRPSVVSVVAYGNGDTKLGSGTGFCVSPSRIITNFHVIKGSKRVEIRTSVGTIFKVIRVESGDEKSDLALLETTPLSPQVKPLPVSRRSPRVGERVLVLGDPLGLAGSVSDGIVSALRSVADVGKLIQITAPISPGSSGSPVVNMEGEVIGVATLFLERGQNLNFAISSETLFDRWQNLLMESNVKSSSEPKSGRWRLLDKNVSYDTKTLTRTPSIVSSWIRYNDADGSHTNVLSEFNCKTSQIRSIRSLAYDQDGGSAREIARDGIWKGLVPDSIGEEMHNVFCKQARDYQSSVDYDLYLQLYRQGNVLREARRYDDAIEVYSRMIVELPEYAGWAFDSIARLKLQQGKVREARNAVMESMRLEDPEAGTYSTLGDVYAAEKNYRSAIDVYWKSLQMSEGIDLFLRGHSLELVYKETKNELGLVKLFSFLIDKGIDKYRELADIHDKRKLTALARTTRVKGTRFLENKVAKGDANSNDFFSLSDLYQTLQNSAKEESTYILGLQKFPNDKLLTYGLSTLYNKSKRWNEAVEICEAFLRQNESSSKELLILHALREAYKALGRTNDAARISKQLSEN